MRTMLAQALGKAGIVAIRQTMVRSDQDIHTGFQIPSLLVKCEGIQAIFLGFQCQSPGKTIVT